MTQALPHVSLDNSRLVRFLTDLSVSAVQVSHEQFSDRLGQLIDFSDSITLSEAHAQAHDVENEDVLAFRDGITEEFLRARSDIVQSAMRSFFPGPGPMRIKWPVREEQAPVDCADATAPFMKFYRSQQVDLSTKIRGLHQRTRDAVAQLSPKMSRIAALDAALGNALAGHSQRFLYAVPRLLERRVEHLHSQFLQQAEQDDQTEALWADTREQLRREIQGLLLAEIEIRLLPALGLIEALNEDTHDTPEKETPDED